MTAILSSGVGHSPAAPPQSAPARKQLGALDAYFAHQASGRGTGGTLGGWLSDTSETGADPFSLDALFPDPLGAAGGSLLGG